MAGHALENGRYGGGSAGSENRYCRPAVDTDQFEDAKEGAEAHSPLHKDMAREPAAQTNTMGGSRGQVNGASYGRDKGQRGF